MTSLHLYDTGESQQLSWFLSLVGIVGVNCPFAFKNSHIIFRFLLADRT